MIVLKLILLTPWHTIDSIEIASAIGAIKRVEPFVPQSTLLSIYNSLVNPILITAA